MKVGLLVALSDLNPAYSIAGVARDHLEMLKDHEFELVFITTSDFTDHGKVPKNVEVRTYPRIKDYSEPGTDKWNEGTFISYVNEAGSVLKTVLADLDHVITHDLLFLDCYLWANCAIREAQKELPNIKWLHWVHSGPGQRREETWPMSELYRGLPNSQYCYPNGTDITKVAEMLNIPEGAVRKVFNTVSPLGLYDFHDLTKKLWTDYKLWDQDYICVYPTRCTYAKQPHKLINLMANIKAHQKKVKLIICNSWANGEDEIKFTQSMREEGEKLGVSSDLIITSELGKEWELGVPRQVVTDLMRVSDMFVMPSISETASLVMLEAALAKNLIMVNEDLCCMMEFGGQRIDDGSSKRVIYSQLGSYTKNQIDESDVWYCDQANRFIQYSEDDKAISFFKYVRRYHSPEWVYINQVQPLLS